MGWQLHENELPGWASVVKKVILVQPSSAASERVFLIQNLFDEKQQNCLEEHASLMLQYNRRIGFKKSIVASLMPIPDAGSFFR